MEIRVLQYFLAVAREENITRAAALLHITQPTLSRQLMQMEEELGVRLFCRGRHKILLTEEGMLLRRRAQEIVDLAEKTEKELAHGEEAVSGEISIGCGETRNMKPLSDMAASFRQKYPDVRFHFYIKESQRKKHFHLLRWLSPLLSPISCISIMFSNYLLMW